MLSIISSLTFNDVFHTESLYFFSRHHILFLKTKRQSRKSKIDAKSNPMKTPKFFLFQPCLFTSHEIFESIALHCIILNIVQDAPSSRYRSILSHFLVKNNAFGENCNVMGIYMPWIRGKRNGNLMEKS